MPNGFLARAHIILKGGPLGFGADKNWQNLCPWRKTSPQAKRHQHYSFSLKWFSNFHHQITSECEISQFDCFMIPCHLGLQLQRILTY